MTDLATNPDVLKKHLLELAHRVKGRAGKKGQEQERSKKQRIRLEQQRQKLLDLYLDGLVSRDDYAGRKSELEGKLQELEQEVAEDFQLPPIDESLVARSVNAFAEQARGKLATMNQEEMRVFLMHLLDDMTFDWQKGEVRLVGHIPPLNERQILSQLSGKHMPVALRKIPLCFELTVEV